MSMPTNLVLIRHGESEANVIQRKIKKGEIPCFPPEYKNARDREFRLSKLGVKQAKETGKALKKLYPNGFDEILVSDFTRAKETVALICLSAGWKEVKIRIDPQLGERNWGKFHELTDEQRKAVFHNKKHDPLNTAMPDGETLLNTRLRARVLLERCARQFTDKKVLVVSHGEYMECVWSEISAMRTEAQVKFFESPAGDIKNCQVVEFVSKPDKNGVNKFNKYRSINPFFGIERGFKTIKRETLTPSQILEEVSQYKSIVES